MRGRPFYHNRTHAQCLGCRKFMTEEDYEYTKVLGKKLCMRCIAEDKEEEITPLIFDKPTTDGEQNFRNAQERERQLKEMLKEKTL